MYGAPHAFRPATETGVILDLRAHLSLHTNDSHIYYVPSKQYYIFFCLHLKKKKKEECINLKKAMRMCRFLVVLTFPAAIATGAF